MDKLLLFDSLKAMMILMKEPVALAVFNEIC